MLNVLRLRTRSFPCSVLRHSPAFCPGPRTRISTFADAREEETLPRYDPQKFYPVSIGQTFDERYKVVAKLGFGGQSTIWLAQDVQRFVDKSCVASAFLVNDFLVVGYRKIDLSPSKFSPAMQLKISLQRMS